MSDALWRVAAPNPEAASPLVRELGLPPVIAGLLVNRGITTPAQAHQFLHPSLDDLHDPYALPDMRVAVERLAGAIENKERIFLHGDYDVDGVSSAALCQRALFALGADIVGHVPRRSDGYDLQLSGVEQARALGARLILTADCGVCAVAPIRHARSLGIDVIVTDHHRPNPELPPANAIVNPYRSDCDAPPFRELCGAGVAFKVLDALVARLQPRHQESFRANLLDLVALGTVADVTPLVGENRVLVAHGLRTLSRAKKPGIRALLQAAGAQGRPISATTIGWTIGPRLNAAGRMEDAALAFRLLATSDEAEAQLLAGEIELLAERSREESRRVTTEAMTLALLPENENRRVLVLAQDSWGKGVVGIAATRIVERCGRPVVLLSYNRDNDHWHGSARSVGQFNLHQAFHACADLLGNFGGHSGAAGVSLPSGNLDAFRDRLDVLAADILGDEPFVPEILVDAEVDGSEWSLALLEWLERLEPFGRDNPEPLFLTRGATVAARDKIGKDGSTLRLQLKLPGRSGFLKAIKFGAGDWADQVNPGDDVDIVYTPKINEWQGSQSLELRLEDMRPAAD